MDIGSLLDAAEWSLIGPSASLDHETRDRRRGDAELTRALAAEDRVDELHHVLGLDSVDGEGATS
jgi:hypothetical protein